MSDRRVGRFLFLCQTETHRGRRLLGSHVTREIEVESIADHFDLESRHNLQLHPIMYIRLCDTETRMIYILLTGSECISIELEFAKVSFYIGLI